MSLLNNLKTDNTIAEDKDSVGSGGTLESGLHNVTISMAYLTKSAGGAVGLVLNMKTDGGRDIRQTLWMTAGTAKGGNNFYTDKDGAKHYLPGFTHANNLALLTVGKEISAVDTEMKVVNVYSPEAKAEVPTKVEVLMELLGKEIIVGLIKQTVDKTAKNDAGVYEPTGETREENEIDKFFRAKDKMTTAEIRAQVEEATFIETWDQKWTGKVRNKSKGGSGTAGVPKMPGAALGGASKKPTTSLFA